MSSTSNRRIVTKTAKGVIRAFRFVKYDTDGGVLECDANERAIGISQSEATASGQAIEVALPGGGAILKLGSGGAAHGKILTSDADGKGTVADAAGEWCGAICHEAGLENDEVAVEVIAMNAHASDA